MPDPVPEAVSPAPVLTEIQSGEGLSLSAAGRLFPGHRGGATVDPSTVFRWVTRGTTVRGRAVKLEAVRAGARWLTSRGAVARFVAALTDAAVPASDTPVPTSRTPSARSRAAEAAGRELRRRGC